MFLALLNRNCEIKRKTSTQNATGEQFYTYTTHLSTITRYAKNGSTQRTTEAFETTTYNYLFFFQKTVDIILSDRIYIDNFIFEVTSVDNFDDMTNLHHIQVEAIKIEN